MRIAIVDDDSQFLAQAYDTLQCILSERRIPAEIKRFGSAEDLLTQTKRGEAFDIYLLDVIMPGADGITLARQLRQNQPETPIVFFTTSREFAVEAFNIAASGYVIKPFKPEALAKVFDIALKHLSLVTERKILLKLPEGTMSVRLSDIVMAETDKHYLDIVLADGRSFMVRQTLQELYDQLNDNTRFCRIGRKFLVNLARVADFTGTQLSFAGGRTLTIPRRLRAEVKAAYLNYYSTNPALTPACKPA